VRCEAGGGVHGIPESGEVERFLLSDGADKGAALVDGSAERDPGLRLPVARSRHELLGRADRIRGIVIPRETRYEERYQLVADKLVDDAVPGVHGRGRNRVEPGHEAPETLVTELFGDGGRPAYVREEERELDFGAARVLLERMDAAAADTPIEA
jgi:hypothetical protein